MGPSYCMKVCQEIDDRLEQLCSSISNDLFVVKLKYISRVVLLGSEFFVQTFHRSVMYPRHMILSEEHGPNNILSLFANTGASPDFLQAVVIPNILSLAWEVDRDPDNRGRKVKKLLVQIEVQENDDHDDDDDDDDEIDQVLDDSLNTSNFKPATSSSIQELKRVRVGDDEDSLLASKKRRKLEDVSSKKQCTICLDEFLDGDEVTSMPCGHVYHDGCIVKWLQTSHLCPLCRYQMPS